MLPSEDFCSLNDYIDYLRNEIQIGAFDVEVNGGAQFRRLMMEAQTPEAENGGFWILDSGAEYLMKDQHGSESNRRKGGGPFVWVPHPGSTNQERGSDSLFAF